MKAHLLTGLLVLAVCLQIYAVSVAGNVATAVGTSAAASGSNGGGVATAAGTATATGSGNRGGKGSATGSATATVAGNTAVATSAATAVATTDSSTGYHIPCNCERDYNPVCASNGKTYANKCILATIAAYNRRHRYEPIGLHSYGECPQSTCHCVKVYAPVCGTDGHTYPNVCYLECEKNRCNRLGIYKRLEIAHRGVCRRYACRCTDAYIPVCGTDNLTYRSVCILDCISRYHQSYGRPCIGVKHSGPCTNECCSCTREYVPICASDGKTYDNACLLRCENRRRQQLGLPCLVPRHSGVCCEKCICQPVYDPVCASNVVTFGNECLLKCENKRRAAHRPPLPALTVRSCGVCPCKCNHIYDPVCASDGKTYGNECLLKCENKRRKDLGLRLLTIVSKGPCECCCTYCPKNYCPVCGSDGKTYDNICFLECSIRCSDPCARLHKDCDGPCPCCQS